jgi:hypothetical protein
VADHYGRFLLRFCPAVIAGIACGLAARTLLTDTHLLIRGSIAATAGVAVFGIVAYALRAEELRDVVAWGMQKARRRSVKQI